VVRNKRTKQMREVNRNVKNTNKRREQQGKRIKK
jgi:hypothetical protein